MSRKRKTQIYIFVVLVASVVSLSVAYAVLSTTLTINGTTTVNSSSWNIELRQPASTSSLIYEITGSATYTLPTLTTTSIEIYNVSFTKPGDSVTFQFTLFNNGTLPGELTSIITSTPTCTSSTGNTSDATLVCDNLIYNLRYEDESPVSIGDVVAYGSSEYTYICYNGSTRDIYDGTNKILLTIGYSKDATSVPSSTVTVSNLKTEFIFSQTDKTCTYYHYQAPA